MENSEVAGVAIGFCLGDLDALNSFVLCVPTIDIRGLADDSRDLLLFLDQEKDSRSVRSPDEVIRLPASIPADLP